jgi:hypothetical protein
LEQAALYEIGQTCDEQPDEETQSLLMHVVYLLGEVHTPNSLNVVLEILRQSFEAVDFYFGDYGDVTLIPTLYLLGRERLDDLLAFVKEPSLESFHKDYVFYAVSEIVKKEPERRAEALAWFREVLRLFTADMKDAIYCDGKLGGYLVSVLCDIRAKELLPEIEGLFATGLINESDCGDLDEVQWSMTNQEVSTQYNLATDIYERYRTFCKL